MCGGAISFASGTYHHHHNTCMWNVYFSLVIIMGKQCSETCVVVSYMYKQVTLYLY